MRIEITGAQTHDSRAFGAFIGWKKQSAAIVADKAYGSKAIRQAIAEEGALAETDCSCAANWNLAAALIASR